MVGFYGVAILGCDQIVNKPFVLIFLIMGNLL